MRGIGAIGAAAGRGTRKKRHHQRHIPIAEQLRLPRHLRRRLAHQAQNQARKATAPDVAAAKAGIRSVKQARRRELSSIAGAGQQLENSLRQSLKGVKHVGLRGLNLAEVVQEISTRQAEVPASTQLLKADARQGFASDLSSARSDLQSARLDRAHKEQSILAESLKSAKLHLAARLKSEASARSSGTSATSKEKERKKELQAAIRIAALKYHEGPSSGKWKPPYTNSSDWSKYIASILSSEGVTNPAIAAHGAREAMFRILNNKAKSAGFKDVSRNFFHRWLQAQLHK
jgi:hypothetical protein